jgi:MSHA biogenesis protein MshE
VPKRTEHVRITSILIEAGVVTRRQVDEAVGRQRSTGRRIGETLVELGAATEEDIGWALARQLRLPFVDPRPDALDRRLLESFPRGLLQRLDAVPLVDEPAALSVAVADPLDPDLVRELERVSGRSVSLSIATPTTIRSVLREVLGMPSAPGAGTTANGTEGSRERSGWDVLLQHVGEARRAGAAEVHLIARRGSVEAFHRIGSRLLSRGSEPPEALDALRAGLEQLGFRPGDAASAHAKGRVICPLGPDSLDVGVSVLRTAEGACVVLDLSGDPARVPGLEDLGLDAVDLATLRGALDAAAGLGIVTGPPKSGCSTTLSCLLAEASRPERRSLALGSEAVSDPGIAWPEIAVAQSVDVLALDGLAIGDGVHAVVGPAAAGRILLVRTDWTDTFALLERLAGDPAGRAALADRLLFVVQQRLLRLDRPAGTPEAPWPRGDRRALFEVLVPSDALRSALREGRSAPLLRSCAEADGFRRTIDAA